MGMQVESAVAIRAECGPVLANEADPAREHGAITPGIATMKASR